MKYSELFLTFVTVIAKKQVSYIGQIQPKVKFNPRSNSTQGRIMENAIARR